MPVGRRAEPVLKRDRSKPGTGLLRRDTISWQIHRMTEQPLNLILIQKNSRQRRHGRWAVGVYIRVASFEADAERHCCL